MMGFQLVSRFAMMGFQLESLFCYDAFSARVFCYDRFSARVCFAMMGF
jgi:hypothetical protein